MTNKKFLLAAACLCLTAPILAGFALQHYYARYQALQDDVVASLSFSEAEANAVKHATAASNIFTLLRPAIGSDKAEKAVISLGVLNEYIERITLRDHPDSAREVMKDLHNNYVGIEAAKLADNKDAFRLILSLAANSTLLVNHSYNPFFSDKEPDTDVVAFSYRWFDEHRAQIDERIEMKIRRAKWLEDAYKIKLTSLDKSSAVE